MMSSTGFYKHPSKYQQHLPLRPCAHSPAKPGILSRLQRSSDPLWAQHDLPRRVTESWSRLSFQGRSCRSPWHLAPSLHSSSRLPWLPPSKSTYADLPFSSAHPSPWSCWLSPALTQLPHPPCPSGPALQPQWACSLQDLTALSHGGQLALLHHWHKHNTSTMHKSWASENSPFLALQWLAENPRAIHKCADAAMTGLKTGFHRQRDIMQHTPDLVPSSLLAFRNLPHISADFKFPEGFSFVKLTLSLDKLGLGNSWVTMQFTPRPSPKLYGGDKLKVISFSLYTPSVIFPSPPFPTFLKTNWKDKNLQFLCLIWRITTPAAHTQTPTCTAPAPTFPGAHMVPSSGGPFFVLQK